MTNEDFIMMLSRRYYQPLYHYARKICHDRTIAGDIIQETFLIAYQKAGELQNHENIAGWLYQTARYRILHYMEETLYYEELSSIAETVSDNTGFEDRSIARLDLYPELARQLNPQDLRLIIRHYEEGYNYKELAEEYQTTPDSIKMRVQRIRRQLQRNLREYV